MEDALGLAFILLMVALGVAFVIVKVNAYNPNGDLCEHGKRMPDEFCLVCGGTVETDGPTEDGRGPWDYV